jgi:pilus assembly protein Flp/PilA
MKLRDLFELIRIHLPREEGQTMAEYGLLIALIAILVIGAITLFKGALTGTFDTIANAL